MKFYELTQIGEFHVNHNEDYLIIEECGKALKLIAVMDGCSSGTDSHFVATLVGKILRKLAKQEAYREYAEKQQKNIKDLTKSITLNLFEELGYFYRKLDLNSDEVLTTLILGLVNAEKKNAEFVIVGDGLIHIDGENFEYENNNKPDYIGYHLNMDKNEWYEEKTSKMSIENFNDLTISTDGIFTMKNHDGKSYPSINESQIIDKFFKDKSNLKNPNKLKITLLEIKDEFGLMPSDDLTMIRIILE
jgi:hypothetical protein